LIFLGLFSQQAFAFNPSCSDIEINTYTIRTEAGKSNIAGFTVSNHSSERFFIDSANAFDSSNNFNVETNGYTREIRAGETGTINVKITGKNYASGITENAFIELRGHFLGGKTCEFQDFGAKVFKVIIDKTAETGNNYSVSGNTAYACSPTGCGPSCSECSQKGYCPGIKISVPSEINVSEDCDNFDIFIENSNDYRINVRFYSENAFVNPSLISVPKNTSITETVFVKGQAGTITVVAEGINCEFSQTIKINKTQTKGLEDKVEISAGIRETLKGYGLDITLENKTPETISGNLEIKVPKDWNVTGNTAVTLEGFETKETSFEIIPNAPLLGIVPAEIGFSSSGESVSLPIEFRPKGFSGIAGTMLAFLGNNWIFGILILIVIALFALAFYSRKQTLPAYRQNNHITLITKPKEVKA